MRWVDDTGPIDAGILLVPFAATFGPLSLGPGAAVERIGARVAITTRVDLLLFVAHDDLGWTILGTVVAAADGSHLIAPPVPRHDERPPAGGGG